jgi:hypothetical protein
MAAGLLARERDLECAAGGAARDGELLQLVARHLDGFLDRVAEEVAVDVDAVVAELEAEIVDATTGEPIAAECRIALFDREGLGDVGAAELLIWNVWR